MPPANESTPFTRRVRRLARLRHALAVVLLLAAGAVVVVYLLNRHAARLDVGRHPELKAPLLGLQIQQSASGVTISKDEDGHPVFRVFAQRVDKLRQGSQEVLHHVRIAIYDKDGVHADQIAGDEFGYDESTYQLSARGQVHMDLQAPTPVHLEASDLTYDVRAGTGTIARGLTFRYLNAEGSAASARLDSHAGRVELAGGVRVTWRRPGSPDLLVNSEEARVQRLAPAGTDAAIITLERHASIQAGEQSLAADQLTFYVRPDETLRHMEGAGHLHAADTSSNRALQVYAGQGRADFVPTGLHQTVVNSLLLSQGVTMEGANPQRGAASSDHLAAGEVAFLFSPDHHLAQVQARNQARLSVNGTAPQNITAPELDFQFVPAARPTTRQTTPVIAGVRLAAVTSQGRAQVNLASGGPGSGPVYAEADHLHLDFDARQQPALVLGSGDVRLRQTVGPSANVAGSVRTTRSDRLTLRFAAAPDGGAGRAQVEQAIESGRVELRQGDRDLLADQVVYTAGDRKAVFTSQPDSAYSHGLVHGADPQTRFTAPAVTWVANADGGDEVVATGGVSLSRAACSGGCASAAVFSSALPIVVTSASLRWSQPPRSRPLPAADPLAPATLPGTAVFSGQVRLLQSPDLLRADRLTLDGAHNMLEAEGHVQTSLIEAGGKSALPSLASGLALATPTPSSPTAVTITASRLRFDQAARRAVYQDQVVMRTGTATLAAPRLEILFAPALPPGSAVRASTSPQRAIATGGVHMSQPGRTATANQVSYDFAQRLVRLDGGPPSILDAERGTITGDPLTFSLASDEIQVGSNSGTRASGKTVVHP